MGTFDDNRRTHAARTGAFRRVAFTLEPARRRPRPAPRASSASRSSRPTPPGSSRTATRPTTSRSPGLQQRLEAIGDPKVVIGVSGGLDSTHALIVAAQAMDRAGRPRSDILAFTLPGFATERGHEGQRARADARARRHRRRSSTSRRPRELMLARDRPPVRRAASRSTTSPSRTSRPACAPTTCSASPTSAAGSCSAPATCPSSRSAGRPTASATR